MSYARITLYAADEETGFLVASYGDYDKSKNQYHVPIDDVSELIDYVVTVAERISMRIQWPSGRTTLLTVIEDDL
jgi:hypothetical protein